MCHALFPPVSITDPNFTFKYMCVHYRRKVFPSMCVPSDKPGEKASLTGIL